MHAIPYFSDHLDRTILISSLSMHGKRPSIRLKTYFISAFWNQVTECIFPAFTNHQRWKIQKDNSRVLASQWAQLPCSLKHLHAAPGLYVQRADNGRDFSDAQFQSNCE